jgi:hypothetical protein
MPPRYGNRISALQAQIGEFPRQNCPSNHPGFFLQARPMQAAKQGIEVHFHRPGLPNNLLQSTRPKIA